MNDFCGDL